MDNASDRIDEMAVEAALAGDMDRARQLADAALEFYEFSEAELTELKMFYGDDFDTLFCSKPTCQ